VVPFGAQALLRQVIDGGRNGVAERAENRENRGQSESAELDMGSGLISICDEAGNLASVTDPEGGTTQWVYDDEDRLVQETAPDGGSKHYSYDEAGDLVRYEDCDGGVRQYAYDSNHRVVTETWYADTADADAQQDAQNTILYAYDASGRIVSESDDVSSNTYTYDEQGRLLSVTAGWH